MEVCLGEPSNTDADLICTVVPLFILHRKNVPAQDAFLTVVRSLPADQLLPAEAKIENIVDCHETNKCDNDCEFSSKLVQTRSESDLDIVDVVSTCSKDECADELDTRSLPSSDGHSSDTIIESSAQNADPSLTDQPIASGGLKANSPCKPSVNLIDLHRKPVVLLRRIDPSIYRLYTASNGTSKSHDGATQSQTFDSTSGKNKSNSKSNVDFPRTISSKNVHVFWKRSEDKLYHCTECSSSFVTSKAIRTHVLSLHKSLAPYQCHDCGQSFMRLKTLKRHITRVHCMDNPNFCSICVKLFFSASTLNQHMQHRHPEHYKPELNTSDSAHKRRSHTENSSAPFVCGDCKHSFNTEAAINGHACTQASHVGNTFSRDNVVCKAEVDSKLFASIKFCREQIGDRRIRQQLFKCPVCDQCFGREFVLKRHVATVHANNCANVCGACGRRCISSGRLKQHLLYCRAQGGDVRFSAKTDPERNNRAADVQLVSEYSCGSPDCQSNSDTTEYLSGQEDGTEKRIDDATITCDKMSASSTHADLHNSEDHTSHQCPVCHQTFASSSICGNHILTTHRTDKESLKCPVCDQCFVVESRLKRHCANVHGNDSKNVCIACGKLFHSQQILEQHLLCCCAVQKQFATCHMCGFHCETANSLRDHICSPVSGSQKEDYFCYDCKQGFALFESFSNHKCAAEVSPHGQVSCDGTTCENVTNGQPESSSSSGELHDCHSVTVGANDYSDSALPGLDYSSDTDRSGKLVAASKFKCADCPTLCFSMKKGLDKRTMNVHATCAHLQCSVCSASFTEQMKYNRHMIIHSADNPYICDICNKGLTSSNMLIRHRIYKHGIKNVDYVCDQCGKRFPTPRSLKGHLCLNPSRHGSDNKGNLSAEMHHSVENSHLPSKKPMPAALDTAAKKYPQCNECGQLFLDYRRLGLHRLSKHGTDRNLHQCPQCHHNYANRKQLRVHVKLFHVSCAPYLCPDCKEHFRTASLLMRHMKIHSASNPNVCDICNKGFFSARSLKTHMIYRHKLSSSKHSHKCKVCGDIFDTVMDLSLHLKLHRSKGMYFFCDKCSVSFSSHLAFKKHLCASAGSGYLSLGDHDSNMLCGSTGEPQNFHDVSVEANANSDSVLHDLEKSSNIHVGHIPDERGKPVAISKLKCADCPTLCFGRKKALNKHMMDAHLLRVPFRCSVCNASYTDQLKYNRHMIIHSADYPNICDICNRGFSSSTRLIRHKIDKHGMKSVDYVCDQCGKKFSTPKSLKGHFCLNSSSHCSDNKVNMVTENSVENSNLSSDKPILADDDISANKYPQCNVCGQLFLDYLRLISHRFSKHGTDGNLLQCLECHHNYANRRQLIKHIKRFHLSFAPYLCPDCNDHFRTAPLLVRHIVRIHSTCNLNVCSICNKGFFSARTLKVHTIHRHKSQSSKHSHRCKICGDLFDTAMHLSIHLRSHQSKEKTEDQMFFFCDICNVGFSSRLALDKHLCASTCATGLLGDHKSKTLCGSNEGDISKNANAAHLNGTVQNPVCEVENNAVSSVKLAAPASSSYPRCYDCGKFFMHLHSLKKHLFSQHMHKKVFECGLCQKAYFGIRGLNRHMQSLHKTSLPYCCPDCDKCFYYAQSMKRHMMIHSAGYPYSCTVCKKGFLFERQFKVHMKYHSAELMSQFECQICQRKFHSNVSLSGHLLCHRGVRKKPNKIQVNKRFACQVCCRTFSCKSRLQDHYCRGGRTYKLVCETCGEEFANRDRFETHGLRHLPKIYGCDHCGRKYQSLERLNTHKKQAHTSHCMTRTFVCSVCSKSFAYHSALMIHEATHEEPKITCEECGKQFRQLGQLTSHMRTHTGVKPYHCTYCGKAFSQRDRQLSHERAVHTLERPFKCSDCGKAFATGTELKDHSIVMHSGIKAFACDICDRKFALNRAMTRHKKNVHQKAVRLCELQM